LNQTGAFVMMLAMMKTKFSISFCKNCSYFIQNSQNISAKIFTRTQHWSQTLSVSLFRGNETTVVDQHERAKDEGVGQGDQIGRFFTTLGDFSPDWAKFHLLGDCLGTFYVY
jgi:hypothetical protein